LSIGSSVISIRPPSTSLVAIVWLYPISITPCLSYCFTPNNHPCRHHYKN
jgi:hypothetical protein